MDESQPDKIWNTIKSRSFINICKHCLVTSHSNANRNLHNVCCDKSLDIFQLLPLFSWEMTYLWHPRHQFHVLCLICEAEIFPIPTSSFPTSFVGTQAGANDPPLKPPHRISRPHLLASWPLKVITSVTQLQVVISLSLDTDNLVELNELFENMNLSLIVYCIVSK